MKLERQPDGMFHHDMGGGVIHKTPLCEIDRTTMETWAATLIQQAQDAIDYGFGTCVDGTPYDLSNYLCDTHGGNVPWDTQRFEHLYTELIANPKFVPTMKAFEAKYGDINFPLTWKEYKQEAGIE